MRKSVMLIPIAILSSWTLSASDINLDRWYIANWRGSPPATLGAAPSADNSPFSNPGDGPWTFGLTVPATLIVTNSNQNGDHFDVLNFGLSLGHTSDAVPGPGSCSDPIDCLADMRITRGIFLLRPGSYSLSLVTLPGSSSDGNGALFKIQTSGAAVLPQSGIFSQVVSGGSWNTSITLINTSTTTAPVSLAFWADDGSALTLSFKTSQRGAAQSGSGSSLNQIIDPGATLLVEIQAPASSPTNVGWVEVMASDAIMGFATVGLETLDGRTAEGIAPLEGRGPSSFVLPYDNTRGFTTGAAFVNLSATAAATITISTLDDRGTELDVQAITLPANGRGSFDSDDQIPITIGRRGIIKLRNVSGGGLAGLGFRFSPFGTFTYIPVLTQR